MTRLTRLLPFLAWFPMAREALRADLIAGVTVALVLIPQSMAYAQLAGMPPYYGLYAAFLPVMVGALFGSSRQLATGPVAVVSLLTASALAPLAATGSEQFIALAILLALMVGVMQLLLGAFRLGVVVNFLSHPVVMGFTNAAALIIALSQLNKLLGVSMGRSDSFMKDIWGVLQQSGNTHWPTLVMGLAAFAIMAGFRRYLPKAPGVLIAVAITTLVSWAIGFEQNSASVPERIANEAVRSLARDHVTAERTVADLRRRISERNAELKQTEQGGAGSGQRAAAIRYQIEILSLELEDVQRENRVRRRDLRQFVFERVTGAEAGEDRLYLAGRVPPGLESDGRRWRIQDIRDGQLKLSGGGEVVGTIPPGIPSLALPKIRWSEITTLLSTALVICLVGFMEAISIAKAIATKTRQRVDPNQELLGQGLANVVGSLTQSFPVSGSFSRTAVNFTAGARTGMSSVITALLVLVTLLFLTPLLYHLPQSVLAAIIMMAVVGLINFKAVRHAWEAHRHDGIAAIVTFVATLAFAPHLDSGILVGAGVAIVLFLLRTMNPRVALLSRHSDGTLRDAEYHELPLAEHVVAVRFDGQLYFANVPYFEDAILEISARFPKARHILVVADGINQIDASGEEVIRHLNQRLRENGVTLVFSGLKRQVLDVMERTGLRKEIGEENIYPSENDALHAIFGRIDDPDFNPLTCPLRRLD